MKSLKLIGTVSLLWLALFATQVNAQTPNSGQSFEALLASQVREAKELAEQLTVAANTVDTVLSIGTMYNEVDVPTHRCYVLGTTLGFSSHIKHLQFDRSPVRRAKNSDEAHEFRVRAQSLENFVLVTEEVLRLPRSRRNIAWQLDCAGQYGIAALSGDQIVAGTFYDVIGNGEGIKILGAIEDGFAAKLDAALISNPKVKFIALGSGGGSVREALAAGALIRAKGLSTTVWNNCYSACPLVFAGGVDRNVHSPYPSFGFHQIYTQRGAISLDSPVYTRLAAYLKGMGINERYVLTAMMRANPSEMNMIHGASEELCRARFVTWVQRGCFAQ